MIIGDEVVEFDAAADVLIHFVARVGVAASQSVNNIFLMDIVIQLEKNGEETRAIVKKSRLGNLPKILDVKNYDSIGQALKSSKKIAEENKGGKENE